MLTIIVFAPFLHGSLGPLDELELICVPMVVVIVLLVVKLRSGRSGPKPPRTRLHS